MHLSTYKRKDHFEKHCQKCISAIINNTDDVPTTSTDTRGQVLYASDSVEDSHLLDTNTIVEDLEELNDDSLPVDVTIPSTEFLLESLVDYLQQVIPPVYGCQ